MSALAAPFAWVDKWTHEPCPRRDDLRCLCAITDPAHRHIAAHMTPELNLTLTNGSEPWSVLGAVEALDGWGDDHSGARDVGF